MKYSKIAFIGLALAGFFLDGCGSVEETSKMEQGLTWGPPGVSAFCTLQPPMTGSYWFFQLTWNPDSGAITSSIQWDTQGNSIPSTASSGNMMSNPATWTYSLRLLNGTVVTNSASVALTDNLMMVGTAANGATCTAPLFDGNSGG